ncbi:MAG: VanZ family protein [Dysgonamonadaceae bacterium]|jgi:VanZ family protein|nr:VanZ family protein [Dysgonamonadaceae bacterium]
MLNYLRHILLPLFVGFLIFVVTCLWNGNNIPNLPSGIPWDKVVHFGMFFTLSAVCYFDYYLMHKGKLNKWRWLFWCFLLPMIYGAVVEWLQDNYIPSRSGDRYDFYADTLGSFVATVIAFIYLAKKKKAKKE